MTKVEVEVVLEMRLKMEMVADGGRDGMQKEGKMGPFQGDTKGVGEPHTVSLGGRVLCSTLTEGRVLSLWGNRTRSSSKETEPPGL